jgi:cyclomaltodextrinase
MTFPGAPCIYYGDEIGMEGVHDPGCRGGFPWDEGCWDQELLDYVRRCIALRKAHPALCRGDLNWLFARQDVVAYGRRLDGETLLVLLNAGRWPVTVAVPVADYLPDGSVLSDVWDKFTVKVDQGRAEGIGLPARSGLVLQLLNQV